MVDVDTPIKLPPDAMKSPSIPDGEVDPAMGGEVIFLPAALLYMDKPIMS
jgi:hypothetical protein